jgi:hypothetical protein
MLLYQLLRNVPGTPARNLSKRPATNHRTDVQSIAEHFLVVNSVFEWNRGVRKNLANREKWSGGNVEVNSEKSEIHSVEARREEYPRWTNT